MQVSNIANRILGNSVRAIFTRNLQSSPAIMAKVGDKLPNIDLYEDLPTQKINLQELAQDKKIILFAVPGAFTPGCSKTHLPGYVARAQELRAKGFDDIICVSVNDPFVMAAWGKDQNTAGKIRLLADPKAELAKALDLTVDIAPLGGIRSKRYSLIADKGVITNLQVEPDGTGLSCSLAEKIPIEN